MLCQVRLASVRRSLFISDTERSRFLNHLVKGTREILRAQQGLALHANYHEFCRLLGRLKTNYQLAELVHHSPSLPSLWFHEESLQPAGPPQINYQLAELVPYPPSLP